MKTWHRNMLHILLFFSFVIMCSPRCAAGQKTIGVILSADIPYYQAIQKAFADEMSAQGLSAENVQIVVLTPAPDTIPWVNSARKLIANQVDVIVTYGAAATQAVTQETSSIPVVFAGVFDPSAAKISGKNVTGIHSKVSIAGILKNMKSMVSFADLTVVFNSAETDTLDQVQEIKGLGKDLGFVATGYDVRGACGNLTVSGKPAVFVTSSSKATQCLETIAQAARAGKVAIATGMGGTGDEGVLLSTYASPQEQGKEAAKMVAEIIQGAQPSKISVKAPSMIEMLINLQEANSLGLTVPFDLLTSATKVVK